MLKPWQAELIAEEEGIDPAKDDLIESAIYLKAAFKALDTATDKLIDAQSILQDYPMGNKVGSIYESVLELWSEVGKLAELYGKGERDER